MLKILKGKLKKLHTLLVNLGLDHCCWQKVWMGAWKSFYNSKIQRIWADTKLSLHWVVYGSAVLKTGFTCHRKRIHKHLYGKDCIYEYLTSVVFISTQLLNTTLQMTISSDVTIWGMLNWKQSLLESARHTVGMSNQLYTTNLPCRDYGRWKGKDLKEC